MDIRRVSRKLFGGDVYVVLYAYFQADYRPGSLPTGGYPEFRGGGGVNPPAPLDTRLDITEQSECG
jgi:hypothetical protein